MPEDVLNTPPLTNAPSPAAAQKAQKLKTPSVLFVHYYGVLFLGIVGAFLLAGFSILRPELDRYKLLQAQAAGKATQLQDQQRYLSSLNRSIAAAQEIPAETLADVEEALPSEPGIPELLTALSRIADLHGVALSDIQFTKPTDNLEKGPAASSGGAAVQSLSIGMNLSSPDYATTRRYLDAIERNLRLFDIQTIALAPGQGESGQVYAIQLQTYLLPPVARP